MAQKRMFDKSIIETDNFMDMPISTKAVYFLLGMEADDEGFVSPNRVTRLYGGSEDDIKILMAKNFIIKFQSGVVVITDWKKNNWLDSRRIKDTVYQEEKQLLEVKNNQYTLSFKNPMLSERLAIIEENSIEESSIEENIEDKKTTTNKNKNFKKPTLEEVDEYCKKRNNHINPKKFINYYEANGWKVGRNKMKDWKAAVRTWELNDKTFNRKIIDDNPEWLGKEIEIKKASKERQQEIEKILDVYK